LNADIPGPIKASTSNISEGGIGISYEGRKLPLETNVVLTASALEIHKREAKVIWTTFKGNTFESGLKWRC
jgi:hypothetical protein